MNAMWSVIDRAIVIENDHVSEDQVRMAAEEASASIFEQPRTEMCEETGGNQVRLFPVLRDTKIPSSAGGKFEQDEPK